jgi:hypothetical protein
MTIIIGRNKPGFAPDVTHRTRVECVCEIHNTVIYFASDINNLLKCVFISFMQISLSLVLLSESKFCLTSSLTLLCAF